MIIPIHIALPTSATAEPRAKLPPQLARLGDAHSDELVLVELQGALEVTGPKSGTLVGTLTIDNSNKPTLLIGHHLLEGKIATLPKPLAVLQRSDAPVPTKELDGDGMDVDGPLPNSANSENVPPSWDMIAIVRRKIVFGKRPMPIVGLSSAGTNGAVGGS